MSNVSNVSNEDTITRKAPRWAWGQIDRTMADVRDGMLALPLPDAVVLAEKLPSGTMRANVMDAMMAVEHVETVCSPTVVHLSWDQPDLNLAFRLIRHPHRKPDTVLECRQLDEPGEEWHSFEDDASSWECSDSEITTGLCTVVRDLAQAAQHQNGVWNYPKELESVNGLLRDVIAIMGGNITIKPYKDHLDSSPRTDCHKAIGSASD